MTRHNPLACLYLNYLKVLEWELIATKDGVPINHGNRLSKIDKN